MSLTSEKPTQTFAPDSLPSDDPTAVPADSSPASESVTPSAATSPSFFSAAPQGSSTPQVFKGWQRLSLQTKAILAAVAIGTLPVLVVGSFAYLTADQSITAKITETDKSNAATMSRKVSRFMFERYGDIQVLTNLPILRNAKVKEIVPIEDREKILTRFAETYGVYDSIAMFDLNGDVVVQSSGTPLKNHRDRSYFQEALKTGKPVVSQPDISKSTGKVSVHFAAPVRDAQSQQIIGVVRSRMPVAYLNDVIKEFGANQQEYHLIDAEGKFFLATEENQIGRSAPADFPGLDRLMAAGKTDDAILTDQIDGARQLVAYAPLPELKGVPKLGWSSLIATDTSVAFASQRQLLLALALGTGVTTVLVALVAAALANRATRPILAASSAVEKLGQGDLDTRITVAGEDELAALGTNINRMAEQIQDLLVSQEEASREQLAAQAEVARQQAENARQQQEAKEFLQNRALELLMEVGPLRQGDLTIRANVTEDEIGTIADSYNATINSLRKLVTQVQAAAAQVAQTATKNEGSVKDLSEDTLEQTESIQQAVERIVAMQSSIEMVARNAQAAELAVQVASQTVNQGDEAMNRTVAGIAAIRETVAETAKKVKQLGESSQKISRVVSLISGFADQTNLLALNASIEAAHAGDQGRGFAVVADEVRSLARQSAKATGEIEQLVASIQAETSEVVAAMEAGTQQVVVGTQLVEETRRSLNQITQVSEEVTALVRTIAEAAIQQTEVSTAVSSTITDAAGIANKTSSRAFQALQAFQQLLEVAKDLQNTVGQFKLS